MKDEIKEMLQEIKETVDDYLKIYKLEDDMMYDTINYKASQWYALLDSITNLQEENKDYKSRIEKAIEYITSYEAISTIQGLDKIEKNKKLDERTMNVMVERYLKVHHNLLNILQGVGKDE